MKTLGELSSQYARREDLSISDGEYTHQAIIDAYEAGYEEAVKWISIDDHENPCPNEGDFLIKLEDGSIRRFEEEWQEEFGIDGLVTHWRPF